MCSQIRERGWVWMPEFVKNYVPVCPNNPSIEKNPDLCANCGQCLAVCREEIGVARLCRTDSPERFACIHCGQCAAACPEGALRGKEQWRVVKKAVEDPETIVVISTAPSVRVGLGDCFLEEKGKFVEGQMVSALRALGADYVLDVAFCADLTILEEGTEFLRRVLSGKGRLPQFTSCCPAWVKYVETFHPERISCLSTAKSPISMQGALIKTYLAKERGLDPKKIVSVAVAPCTAKKFEITRREMKSAGEFLNLPEVRDNDYVLTTKELAEWIRSENVDFDNLPESGFDTLMGEGSGAGVIFGNTGGVMEAALRMAYSVLTGEKPEELFLDYQPVRGLDSVKKAEAVIGGKTIRVAVIYGTLEADRLIRSGEIDQYDFVEVMTCPGGCISGAGQPGNGILPVPDTLRRARIRSLYLADTRRETRSALDNGEIKRLYEAFLDKPLGEKAEMLLHTSYHDRRKKLGK